MPLLIMWSWNILISGFTLDASLHPTLDIIIHHGYHKIILFQQDI